MPTAEDIKGRLDTLVEAYQNRCYNESGEQEFRSLLFIARDLLAENEALVRELDQAGGVLVNVCAENTRKLSEVVEERNYLGTALAFSRQALMEADKERDEAKEKLTKIKEKVTQIEFVSKVARVPAIAEALHAILEDS